MGSVKDLKVIKPAEQNSLGVAHFHFSDRYSVFDWGEMPDLITKKGQALCVIGAYFFEKLEEMGISTHYRGLVEGGVTKQLNELTVPSDTMEVSLVRVIKPTVHGNAYDYSQYKSVTANFLIPLEVIYRNALPAGSSVFRRLNDGSLKLEEIGLTEMPQPNDILREPIIDASTKLEITDRYLSWTEAQQISGLSDSEITEIKNVTGEINNLISNKAKDADLINEDGKVEYGYNEKRQLIVVDILGTPDECRFTYNNIPVSKEVARIHYRKTDWYQTVEKAKKEDRANWKEIVTSYPPKLPPQLFNSISQLYQSTCNEITQREWFATPPLADILIEIEEQLNA